MKQQTAIQTPKQILSPQMKGLLPHAAVLATSDHDLLSNSSTGSRFGHDFSQVAVRPSVPIISQGYSNASSPPRIQAKLKIGQPGDKYEQEADRVAEQVMRMPAPQLPSSVGDSLGANSVNSGGGTIQRVCTPCFAEYKVAEDENRSVELANLCPKCRTQGGSGLIQTKSAGVATPEVTPAISSGIQSLQGGGRPMSGPERNFFEPRFGADFSGVRVHDGARAAGVAQSVNARAFTLGRDVVFGAGEHSSDGLAERKLLAHELTHVVQQSEGKNQRVRRHTLENDPETAPSMTCNVATTTADGIGFLNVIFSVNEYTLSNEAKAAISNFVSNWNLSGAVGIVRVDGFASIDGTPSINWPLSCHRAKILVRELVAPSDSSQGIPANSIEFFAQGETDQFSSALEPNRRAQVHIPPAMALPTPAPPSSESVDFFDQDDQDREQQRICVWDRGGCRQSRSAGIPESEELELYNRECRRGTHYRGPDISMADLQCESGRPNANDQCALSIARSLGTSWLAGLPDCPCIAPTSGFDESNTGIGCFHPGATRCFRRNSGIHAQQCCYGSSNELITEGAAAGTPDFFSSSSDFPNHQSYDVWPFRILGFMDYNRYWIPNNHRGCQPNSISGEPSCEPYHTMLAIRPDLCRVP